MGLWPMKGSELGLLLRMPSVQCNKGVKPGLGNLQSSEIVNKAKMMAPPAHTATASTSTLCKLLTWDAAGVWQEVIIYFYLFCVCV